VDAEDLVQAQIPGEIEATQSQTIELEPVLRRGKGSRQAGTDTAGGGFCIPFTCRRRWHWH
jgi:hypothetical protein